MPTLTITRGLPASGKTTWAKKYSIDTGYVLDDRRQVVDAWRAIGLTVFQVAPGNF